MKQVDFEDLFECDIETYWDKVFFDDEFNQRLYRERLKFNEWQVVSNDATEQLIRRTIAVQPTMGDLPGPIKKVLGDNFGYHEHGTFDRQTKHYRLEIEPNVAKQKILVSGEMWLEPLGEHRSRRRAKLQVDVRIMMVGKLLEGRIIDEMTRYFREGAVYTNQWVRERGLGG